MSNEWTAAAMRQHLHDAKHLINLALQTMIDQRRRIARLRDTLEQIAAGPPDTPTLKTTPEQRVAWRARMHSNDILPGLGRLESLSLLDDIDTLLAENEWLKAGPTARKALGEPEE